MHNVNHPSLMGAIEQAFPWRDSHYNMTIIIVANVIFCKQFAFKKEPQRSKSIEKITITQSPIIIAFFTFFLLYHINYL